MERLVDTVMRGERRSDLLDRAVLALGILSLCLALGGTLFADKGDVANQDRTPGASAAA